MHNAQCVHKLPFVFMHALHLNIKNELRRNFNTLLLKNDIGELALGLAFDGNETPNQFIVDQGFKLFKLVQVGHKAVADAAPDKCGKCGIAKPEEAALGHAVCFVLEAFGINIVPILKHFGAQQSGMDLRNAVDV